MHTIAFFANKGVSDRTITFKVEWALTGQCLEPFVGEQAVYAYKRKAVA